MNIKMIEDNRKDNIITREYREYLLQIEALAFLRKSKLINDEEFEQIKRNIIPIY